MLKTIERPVRTSRDFERDASIEAACVEAIRAGHPDIGTLVRLGKTVYYTFARGDYVESTSARKILQRLGECE